MLDDKGISFSRKSVRFTLTALSGEAFAGAYRVVASKTPRPWDAAIRVPLSEALSNAKRRSLIPSSRNS